MDKPPSLLSFAKRWQESIAKEFAKKPRLAFVGGLIGVSAFLAFLSGLNKTPQLSLAPQIQPQIQVPPVAIVQQPQPVAQNNSPVILMAQDGTFLGVVSNDKYDPQSICNSMGQYGNPAFASSVWSEIGLYGSDYSTTSAYNPNAQQPPLIVQGQQPIAVLTKNPNLRGGFDPDLLFQNVCRQQSDVASQLDYQAKMQQINAESINKAIKAGIDAFK